MYVNILESLVDGDFYQGGTAGFVDPGVWSPGSTNSTLNNADKTIEV